VSAVAVLCVLQLMSLRQASAALLTMWDPAFENSHKCKSFTKAVSEVSAPVKTDKNTVGEPCNPVTPSRQ